ncbi:sensor histidine kinase [Nisaea nitritireducens]|uniref:sensor histidine kinase n=1 Tax=Nisaea nitritireducens TaxID=568392 RepID=UPI001865A792|nr:PAS domain-containing sensor histidine kinase [Nisaea nitritireducens]
MLSAQNLELFLESVPDAMLIVDSGGQIAMTNGRVEELFGYSKSELVGSQVEMLMPAAHRKRHVGFRERYVEAPRARNMASNYELQGVRRSGEQFPVEISLSPVPVGSDILILSAIRDVTERLERERRARANEVELEKLVNVNRFLFSLSHELRTPLNAISGFAATLLMGLSGPLNDEQQDHLKTIEQSAEHLLALINQLLSLMQPEFNSENMIIEKIDGRDAASAVCKMMEREASAKGLSFKLDGPEKPIKLKSSHRMLTQILINLVGNAVKYTDRGDVTVRIRRCGRGDGAAVQFEVTDTGIGIPDEARERLFEMFYRANRDQEKEGTGIGLFISQQLAVRLGGRIEFSSAQGQGSKFTLSLPQKGV